MGIEDDSRRERIDELLSIYGDALRTQPKLSPAEFLANYPDAPVEVRPLLDTHFAVARAMVGLSKSESRALLRVDGELLENGELAPATITDLWHAVELLLLHQAGDLVDAPRIVRLFQLVAHGVRDDVAFSEVTEHCSSDIEISARAFSRDLETLIEEEYVEVVGEPVSGGPHAGMHRLTHHGRSRALRLVTWANARVPAILTAVQWAAVQATLSLSHLDARVANLPDRSKA